jgi:hypothetical protein
MNNRFVKVVAAGLVVPVFLEHKPHLDVSVAVSEPLPTMPFNMVSTATAVVMPSLLSDWMLKDFE